MSLKDTIQSALHQLSDAVEKSFETSLFSTTTHAADLKVSNLRKAFRTLEGYFSCYLAELNNARNAAIPIHRLPNEVLVAIINYVLMDYGKHVVHSTDTLESPCYKALSNLGQVSRRWYSVVINTPSLWTTVPLCGNPALISVIATRSRTLPLRIEGQIVAYNDDEGIALSKAAMKQAIRERVVSVSRMIGPQLRRWQTVDLSLLWFSLKPLDEVLAQPAPLLHSVALKVDGVHADEIGKLKLFAGAAENLRHVKLERLYVEWGSPVFRGLTTLSLGEVGGRGGPRMGELLEILRGSPGLEKLSLRKVYLGREAEWLEETTSPISMKQLRELVLSDLGPGSAQYIVRHIQDLDNCRTMDIDFLSCHMMDVSSLQATFAHLGSTMERIFSPPKRLVVQIFDSKSVSISRLSGGSSFFFEGREAGGLGTVESMLAWLPTMLNLSYIDIPVHLQVNAREKLSTLSDIRTMNVVLLEVTHPIKAFGEAKSKVQIGCQPLLKALGGGIQTEGWEEGPAFPRLKKFRVDYSDVTYIWEAVEMVSNRYSDQTLAPPPKFKVSLRRHTDLLPEMHKVAAVIGKEKVLVHMKWDGFSMGRDPAKDPGDVYQSDPATEFDKTLKDSTGDD